MLFASLIIRHCKDGTIGGTFCGGRPGDGTDFGVVHFGFGDSDLEGV